MKKQDKKVLHDIQKNTSMALNAIETISEKVQNDQLLQELSKERLLYSSIYNKASHRLQHEHENNYKSSIVQDMLSKGAIHMNTLTNCSTSKIAEIMIQENTKGLTDMWRTMNHNKESDKMSLEIANELMAFEEKNISKLKAFL